MRAWPLLGNCHSSPAARTHPSPPPGSPGLEVLRLGKGGWGLSAWPREDTVVPSWVGGAVAQWVPAGEAAAPVLGQE